MPVNVFASALHGLTAVEFAQRRLNVTRRTVVRRNGRRTRNRLQFDRVAQSGLGRLTPDAARRRRPWLDPGALPPLLPPPLAAARPVKRDLEAQSRRRRKITVVVVVVDGCQKGAAMMRYGGRVSVRSLRSVASADAVSLTTVVIAAAQDREVQATCSQQTDKQRSRQHHLAQQLTDREIQRICKTRQS